MADVIGKPSFQKPRHVAKTLYGNPHNEGPISVRRMIGGPDMPSFDPIAIMDWSKVKKAKALPDHPHRGIEVVTYLEKGAFWHEDFDGYECGIKSGDIQWVTAGRGTVHSEWPTAEGDNIGMQLWVNLPTKNKWVEPTYHITECKDILRVENDGVEVKIISGESFGVKSPVYTVNPLLFLEFKLQPGAEVHQSIPESFNVCAFVLEGEGVFGDLNTAPTNSLQAAVLTAGDGISVWNKSSEPLRFFLIGGEPTNEPILKGRDVVMRNQAEIDQAYEDYNNYTNGFEKAKNWKSSAMKILEAN